jgi:hypothetical protein
MMRKDKDKEGGGGRRRKEEEGGGGGRRRRERRAPGVSALDAKLQTGGLSRPLPSAPRTRQICVRGISMRVEAV